MAQPINSWAEFKKVLRQLKNPEVRETFETVIIDTADIAYSYCEKYICANAKNSQGGFGVDSIGDIPYGQGYGMIETEFDEALRSIVQMDYGLVIISHAVDKTFKDENGQEFNQIVPTLDKRGRKVVSRMVDIIGYSRAIMDEGGNLATKLFIRGTPRYMAGSRFRYTPDVIDFNYVSLTQAINDAIDKQMQEEGSDNFTNEVSNLYKIDESLSFDELISEFNSMVQKLIEDNDEDKFVSYYQPRITEITDKYLGKGNKVSQCSREQVEALSLIVDDMKDLMKD